MLFNTLEFALFIPIVFLTFWLWANNSVRRRNLFIILASYVFYGWWDWRFLSLIAFSSIVDYLVGISLAQTDSPRRRKALLLLSIVVNIGLLGFFKYFNFFIDNAALLIESIGFEAHRSTLQVILPVGISFYTFQTLSYTIDVYRRVLEPTRDWTAFFAFVSFFPQLVAGPIERARHLLPQFDVRSKFDVVLARDGLRQILWGLFKKAVIADNCALIVDHIFGQYETIPAAYLILGAVAFGFQIYGDFSGYSDMAIGTARLFGFDIMRNFAYPYFARDIAEFWRRWHISLTTWFRDYVYIPLGGSRVSKSATIRNTFIIFLVSGFWHGANWTFIVWGLLHALFFMPLLLAGKNRKHLDPIDPNRMLPSLSDAFRILITFAIVSFAWIFFRAPDVSSAFSYIAGIITWQDGSVEYFFPPRVLLVITLMIIVEWIHRDRQHGLEISYIAHRGIRWVIYLVLTVIIAAHGHFGGMNFIYFNF
jgi:D-alanyl-lipoteichoic acid acyltransferase DltB (MBOAT superfamily)